MAISRVFDLYYTYRFLRTLTREWKDTDAYKLGIIDEKGNPLKKSSELKTSEEKDAYTSFIRMVFKLKRQLEKISLGHPILASYAAALWLLKENYGDKFPVESTFLEYLAEQGWVPTTQLDEEFQNYLTKTTTSIRPGVYLHFLTNEDIIVASPTKCIGECFGYPIFKLESDLGKIVYATLSDLAEEEGVPANNVGSGHIAGTTPDSIPGPSTHFCKHPVYDVDSDTWYKCRFGKPKFKRWNKYVSKESGVHEAAKKNFKQPIIVRHKSTGSMIYVRHNPFMRTS